MNKTDIYYNGQYFIFSQGLKKALEERRIRYDEVEEVQREIRKEYETNEKARQKRIKSMDKRYN